MSLEKATINWSVKQISTFVKKGKINFDHIVQRSYVWERKRKSSLIESMILGYPIPPIYAKKIENIENKTKSNDIVYYVMDGKQRLSTVKEFLNDEFALTELPPVVFIDDETDEEAIEDISNLKFSQLPKAIQNLLVTITFNVIYFENLTAEEERELFKRLNAGKPLSSKSKALASCKDIESFIDIGSHELFDEMLSEKAKANKNQVALVMKAWCMLNQNIEDISFESKKFNNLLERSIISDEEKEEITKVLDFIVDTHSIIQTENLNEKVAKKLYTETHLISLMPFFKKAIDKNMTEYMMADWIIDFFGNVDNTSISDKYNVACGSGLAKPVNILSRNEALTESFVDFFKTDGTNNL